MKKWISSFTLIEMLVVIAIIAILAGLLLPALARAREESRRKSCNSNLGQVVKACTTYQEPNGDFFPAFLQGWYTDGIWANINTDYGPPNAIPMQDFQASVNQGNNNNFQPMPSLAVLYPAYVDNVKVFGCPSTSDKPQIAFRYYNGHRHTCFGFTPDPGETGTISGTTPTGVIINGNVVATWVDPAVFTGNEVSGNAKCSYFYDECTNFRDIGPGQAIAADADGYTWMGINGKHPAYYSPGLTAQEDQNGQMTSVTIGWARPTIPNHDNGQNVMYFDGHVKWSDNVYASRDPNDNIYNPQGCVVAGNRWLNTEWGRDTDAYLWDGTIGDSAAPGQ